MRIKTKRPSVFLLLILWAVVLAQVPCMGGSPPQQATETQVSIHLSDSLATVGDRVQLKIIVKTTADVDKITLSSENKEFEVIEQKPTGKRRQQDYTIFEKEMDIAFFKLGEFNVGPFKIDLKKNEEVIDTRETNSVPITVKSVLQEEDKDIRPLKNLIDIEGNPFYVMKFVLIAIAVIALAIIIYIVIKRRKLRGKIEKKPLLSPLEEFQASVTELAGKDLVGKGKPKVHFLELTQIIKRFLHRDYRFNAEDLTTYETLYELKRREQEVPAINHFDFLMNTADLVKFAKFVPDEGVMGQVSGKLEGLFGIYKQRIAEAEAQARRAQAVPGTPGDKEKAS